MRQLKCLIATVGLLLTSCGSGCRGSADPIDIRLSAHRRRQCIEIQWQMRNVSNQPVWVLVGWNEHTLPMAFVTPDGELALVFGEFGPGPDRDALIETDEVLRKFRSIEPGSVLDGSLLLTIPYRQQDTVDNPYEKPGMTTIVRGTKRRLERLTGVFAAAHYWKCDPKDRSFPPRSTARAERWRATVSRAMMTGRRFDGIDRRLIVGIAASNVTDVDLPLEEVVVLYVVDPGETF